MNQPWTNTQTRRSRRLIIAGSVIAMLALMWILLGALWLPALVKREAPKALEATGHKLSIGAFSFNPVTLTVRASDIALADGAGKPVFSLAGLVADLEWRSLLRFGAVLSELRLTRPALFVDIDPEGRVNLAALSRPEAAEKKPAGGLPRFIIGQFAIEEGSIAFADRREGYENRVDNFGITLSNVSSLQGNSGKLKLGAHTTDGAQLDWEGDLSLQPIAASGTLKLAGFPLPSLMPYLDTALAGRISAGSAEATLPHRFSLVEGRPQLTVENASAAVTGLAVSLPGSGKGADAGAPVKLTRFGMEGVNVDLLKRLVTIQKADLNEPVIALTRRADGVIDLTDILARRAPPKDTPPPGEPWTVSLDQFTLEGGRVGFRDNALRLALALDGIAASLKDVSTTGDKPAGFELTAALRDATGKAAGTLSARGETIAATSTFKARLGLEGVALALMQPMLENHARVRIASGTASLGGDVEMSEGKGLRFAGEAGIADVVVHDASAEAAKDATKAGATAPLLKLARFALQGIAVDVDKRQVLTQKAQITGLETSAKRDASGRLDVQKLLVETPPGAVKPVAAELVAAKPATGKPAAQETPWSMRVARTEIDSSSVGFADAASGVALTLEGITARIDDASNDLAKPLAFEFGAGVKGGGKLAARGRATPAAGALTARVEATAIPLALAQPVLDASTRARVLAGTASIAGDLRVNALDGSSKESFRFTGSVGVGELAMEERQQGPAEAVPSTQIMGWKSLSTDSLRVSGMPLRVDMDELRLVAPVGRLAIAADRSLNLGRAFTPLPVPVAQATPSAAPLVTAPAAATPPAQSNDPGFSLSLRRLRVEQALLDFSDASISPGFATRIHNLGGTLNGLSTERGTRSQFSLEGAVDEFGFARLSGALNPFQPREQTNFRVEFRNLDLTRASSYSIKFAGYRIAAGRLSLDLRYRINDGRLEGENKAVFDELTLGERIDGPDALKLPLQLAIAILKDSDGRIDLDIPVTGNLNDPQFSYGAVIWRAVGNILTRVITAPFRALGSLFGGGNQAEEVKAIALEAGQSRLLPPEREKLKRVADVLAKRPTLRLVVPGRADTAADGERLKRAAVAREVARRAGFDVAEDESAGGLSIEDSRTRSAIRAAFTERFGAPALDQLKAEAEAKTATGEAAKPGMVDRVRNLASGEPQVADARPFYNTLMRRLREAQVLSPDALETLARARSEAVATLLREGGLPAARVQATTVAPVSGDVRAREVKIELELASQ